MVVLQAFNTLHMMYHEATACHVTGDLADLLALMLQVLKVARHVLSEKKSKSLKTDFTFSARFVFLRSFLSAISRALSL